MNRNFKEVILSALDGEECEAIVVGNLGYGCSNERDQVPEELKKNTPVPLECVIEFLNYDYDSGYGRPECHPIYLWTPTRIIFVCEYDGSTHISSIPRHPKEARPEYQ